MWAIERDIINELYYLIYLDVGVLLYRGFVIVSGPEMYVFREIGTFKFVHYCLGIPHVWARYIWVLLYQPSSRHTESCIGLFV